MRTLEARIRRGKTAIREARRRGLNTAAWELHLLQLWETALATAQSSSEFEPWVLWEWRRVSIPEWRRILDDASEKGDSRRQDYANWMLEEILLDPEV